MSIIVRIPQELSTLLLLNWLRIADVALLDSAICQSNLRTVFKELAYSETIVYDYPQREDADFNKDYSRRELFNAWVLNRQAGVTGIAMSLVLEKKIRHRRAFLRLHGHRITWICYDEDTHPHSEWRKALLDLCRCCPNVVKLRCPSYFNKKDYHAIGEAWPAMAHLIPPHNCAVGCIRAMTARFHMLTHLQLPEHFLTNLAATETEALLAGNSNITHLQLGRHDRQLYFAFNLRLMTCCRQLRSLRLIAHNIGVAELQAIAHNCEQLEELQIHVNRPLHGHNDLTPYLKIISARGLLTEFDLKNITNVPAVFFVELAEKSPNLRKLCINRVAMTGAALHALVQYCPQLAILSLQECHALSTMALAALIQGCPKLQHLDLTHCWLTRADSEFLISVAPAALTIILCKCIRGDGGWCPCRWHI